MEEHKLNLFYFNHKISSPIIFFIIEINNDEEEKFIENHTNYLFKILIDNKLANSDNILIFSIIKKHTGKMINWILPSKECNSKILRQIEKNINLINLIINGIIKNSNCETLLIFSIKELVIQDCDINLNYLSDIYIN
jgi:hypothetical protein